MTEDNNSSSSRTKQIGSDSIAKLLFKFSLPAMAAMMVQALYNATDRVFVGRAVGPDGISALTANFPIVLVFIALGMLCGIGGSAFFSIALGEKNNARAEKIIANTLLMVLVLITFSSLLAQVFAEKILSILGASGTIMDLALSYTRIILAGAVINSTAHSMNNFIRAEGSPGTAMKTMMAGGLANIFLDYIFVILLDMGVEGAAIATVISQTLSAFLILSWHLSGKSHIRLRLKNMVPDFYIIRNILAIGSAPFVMQLGASLANGVLNNQLQRYGGDAALSVMGIIFSVMACMFMPVLGLNQGSMPIIGYNYGARQYRRVLDAAAGAIAGATIIFLTGFILTRFWPMQIIMLFGKGTADVAEEGLTALKIYFFMSPLIGFQIIASGFFQATGQPLKSMILSLSRQVLLLIPLSILFPLYFGITGIWLACAVSDFMSALITGTFFLKEAVKMKKLIITSA